VRHRGRQSSSAEPIVAEFQVDGLYRYEVHYGTEPTRGIAKARNSLVELAKQHGCEWMAMFDDDQVAEPDAVYWAWATSRMYSADVVAMKFTPQFPSPTPFWCVPIYFKEKHVTGNMLKHCGTGGVLFRLGEDRFDEGVGLNGGEDTSFFFARHRSGQKPVASAEAVDCLDGGLVQGLVLARSPVRQGN
jgi:succinoglycan biosynthesis protein ExoM